MKQSFTIIIILLVLKYTHQQILLNININQKKSLTNIPIHYNVPGISLNWQTYSNILHYQTFHQFIENSIFYHQIHNAFNIYLNQQSSYISSNSSTINSTHLTNLSYSFSKYTNLPNSYAGIQFYNLNYTQLIHFTDNFTKLLSSNYIHNFGQNVDQYIFKKFKNSTYDIYSYISQIQTFIQLYQQTTSNNYQNYIAGPSIKHTSKNWLLNSSAFFNFTKNNNYTGIFTIQFNFFQNDTDYQKYLSQRLDDAFFQIQLLMRHNPFSITKMKIHYLDGINQITDTFAATLWALDFIITWVQMGGFSINFDINLTSLSYQSMFSYDNTVDQTIKVNSLYYAVLFYQLFIQKLQQSFISIHTITQNFENHKIKTWTISDGKRTNIMIINKDLNISTQGYIKIKAPDMGVAQYFYLSAQSLIQKNNINIMGYTYDKSKDGYGHGNGSKKYKCVGVNGEYLIKLSYSQAVIVYLDKNNVLVNDKVWNEYENKKIIILWILLLTIILL